MLHTKHVYRYEVEREDAQAVVEEEGMQLGRGGGGVLLPASFSAIPLLHCHCSHVPLHHPSFPSESIMVMKLPLVFSTRNRVLLVMFL